MTNKWTSTVHNLSCLFEILIFIVWIVWLCFIVLFLCIYQKYVTLGGSFPIGWIALCCITSCLVFMIIYFTQRPEGLSVIDRLTFKVISATISTVSPRANLWSGRDPVNGWRQLWRCCWLAQAACLSVRAFCSPSAVRRQHNERFNTDPLFPQAPLPGLRMHCFSALERSVTLVIIRATGGCCESSDG